MPINTSRFKRSQWATRSALDKNLKAKANSKNPRITLVVFNQPPELGIDFNQFGNKANKVKGSAKAIPKPVIPALNCMAPPLAVQPPANSDCHKGPLHENATVARGRAIKKIPMNPPTFEAVSILSPQELGKVIS